MIKHIFIAIIILGVLVVAWWGYERYFSAPVVLVSNSLSVPTTQNAESPDVVEANQDEKISVLLANPKLNAIIIITNSADSTAQLLCGSSADGRTIIVMSPSSKYIDMLFRWNVHAHYRVPYTLIIKEGRIIFQSFGTFCSY